MEKFRVPEGVRNWDPWHALPSRFDHSYADFERTFLHKCGRGSVSRGMGGHIFFWPPMRLETEPRLHLCKNVFNFVSLT